MKRIATIWTVLCIVVVVSVVGALVVRTRNKADGPHPEPAAPVGLVDGGWPGISLGGRLQMTTVSTSGREETVELRLTRHGTTWLAEVLQPHSLSGVSVELDRDQFEVYLPMLGRSSTIGGPARRESVMGSVLTFEELAILSDVPPPLFVEESGPERITTSVEVGTYAAIRIHTRLSDRAVTAVEFVDQAGVAKRIDVVMDDTAHTVTGVEVRDLRRSASTRIAFDKLSEP